MIHDTQLFNKGENRLSDLSKTAFDRYSSDIKFLWNGGRIKRSEKGPIYLSDL